MIGQTYCLLVIVSATLSFYFCLIVTGMISLLENPGTGTYYTRLQRIKGTHQILMKELFQLKIFTDFIITLELNEVTTVKIVNQLGLDS